MAERPAPAVIADDLTGACDAGVQFVSRGFSTSVAWDADAFTDEACDVAVLCTASRHQSAGEAAANIDSAVRALHANNRRLVYKKIDSTLSGNIGAEISAAMGALDLSVALVAPAYPQLGRRVVNGQLLLGAEEAPTDRRLHAVVAQEFTGVVTPLTLDNVRQGPSALRQLIDRLESAGGGMLVADARCDDDLTILARAIGDRPDRVLPVGSAGLAAALLANAPFLSEVRRASAQPALATAARSARKAAGVVVLTGSKNPVTIAQIDALLTTGRASRQPLGRTVVDTKRDLIVSVDWDQTPEISMRRFVEGLELQRPACILITGGDTAELFARTATASSICLIGDLLPGIVRGQLVGGCLDGLPIVTKAGGFGRPDALVEAVKYVTDL